jgi:hypothetical protein
MPDISSTLVLLRKPIDAVAAAATDKTKEIVTRLRAGHALKTIYQKLSATQKVKSIWNVDRAITISSFYYPAKIRTKGGFTQQITELDEFPSNQIVLSGIVGQGKSILLRYLLGREMKSGKRLPLFIELRRVPPTGLETYLIQQFHSLVEVWSEPKLFHVFATEGWLSLLLDGFDEIDPSRMQEIGSAIDSIALQYPNIRVEVTSRPNSGIENSPLFDVIPLAPLNLHDLPYFFQKILSKDRSLADRLTAAVQSSKSVQALASTPLLATLLTIVYRAHQRIPTDFPEFYEELFQILLVRHDRSKLGYERKRRTKLGDRDIQQVFEAFCFKTKADGTSSLPRARAVELASASIGSQQQNCDSTEFIEDILRITCLLQEEGGRIEFLHQSVQEFFGARYVASRPDEVAQRFYQLALGEGKWLQWDQVLRFLNQVDKYRASKYFFIPALESTLRELESVDNTATIERLRELVAKKIGVKQTVGKKDNLSSPVVKFFIHQTDARTLFRLDFVHSRLFNKFFGSENVATNAWQAHFDRTTDGQYLTYSQIAEVCMLNPALDSALFEAVDAIRQELIVHRNRVINYVASSAFMGI